MWARAARVLPLLLAACAAMGAAGERCASVNTPKVTRCTGCPPMYKGKMCASTTRYNDQTKAACGCGDSDPVPEDWWTLTQYTAALDCKNLDPEHPFNAWCPTGCGACYELCSTGGSMHGHRPKEGVCRIFKITNRCGDGFKEYPMWCSNNLSWPECKHRPDVCRQLHSTNHFGYPAHFDLQDFHHQIRRGLDWDNVEVTFEPVPCSRWDGKDWDCHCSSFEGELGSGGGRERHTTTSREEGAGGGGGSAEPTQAPAEPPGQCAKEWEQCGGKGLKGPACCQEGCYCRHLGDRGNPHFTHQCIPSHWKGCAYSASNGSAARSAVAKYDTSLRAPWEDIGTASGVPSSVLLAAGMLVAASSGVVALVRAARRQPGAADPEAGAQLLPGTGAGAA